MADSRKMTTQGISDCEMRIADLSEPKTSKSSQYERYELPPGWAWARLSDVVLIGSTQVLPRRAPNHLFNYLALENIESGTGRILDFTPTPGRNIGSNKFTFKPGDVLYGKLRPYLLKVTVAPFEGVSATDLIPLRPQGPIETPYLQRYLLSPQVLEYVHPLMAGIKMPRLRSGDLQAMPIPLPPLPEQRRIAAKIEVLFEQSRTARGALERVPPLLKKFRQSVLAAAFRGDLTRDWREQHPDLEPASTLLERIRAERHRRWEQDFRAKGKNRRRVKYEEPLLADISTLPELPDGWVWTTMDALTYRITSGSRAWRRRCGRGTGTFILAQNIRPGLLDLSRRTRVDAPDDLEAFRARVEVGDILVTIVGNTGDTCVVTHDPGEAYVCQSVALLRPAESLTSRWLGLYLQSDSGGQGQFREFQYGMGRAHLGLPHLRQTVVPMAPMAEQFHVVERIDELFSQADVIEGAVEAVRRRADKLEQSILARAFRGELVPQDPHDEPAPTLLDRIRADRPEERAIRRAPVSRKKARSNT